MRLKNDDINKKYDLNNITNKNISKILPKINRFL